MARFTLPSPSSRSFVSRYGVALAGTVICFGLRFSLHKVLGETAPLQLFTAAVLLASWWGGFGPGAFATLLSAAVGESLFVKPYGLFNFADSGDATRFAIFLFTASAICCVAEAMHRSRRREQDRAELLRTVIDLIPDLIYVKDRESRFVLANNAVAQLIV